MRKIIIAGFPGVGKSTCASIDNKFIDLESSDFHWIYSADIPSQKCKNPEWPQNYVDTIKTIANSTDDSQEYRDSIYIMCSTHKEVLTKLIENKLSFIIVAPKSKDLYIQRYRDRGSSEEFINSLDEHWDEYMQDISSYTIPVIYTDEYLGDILHRNDTYDYLLNKVRDVDRYIYKYL